MHVDLSASADNGAEVVHQLRAQANHLKAEDKHSPEAIAMVEAAISETAKKIGEAGGASSARITIVIQTSVSRQVNRAKGLTTTNPVTSTAPTEVPEGGDESHDYPPRHVPNLRRSSTEESDAAVDNPESGEPPTPATSTKGPTDPNDLAPIGG